MSDADVTRALHVIKRHGAVAIEEMLELFPIIRHTGSNRRGFNLANFKLTLALEIRDEWMRWTKEIPAISFPSEWKIQMRPPATGAIVRFSVNDISVYLDCYSRLGCYDGPYWELYPSEDGDPERFAMMNVDGLLDGLRRAMEANDE